MLMIVLILNGCIPARTYKPSSPVSTVTTPDGITITSAGDTPNPAKTDVASAITTFPLGIGQIIEFNSNTGTYKLTLAKDTVITTKSQEVRTTGPTAFSPPKGPSLAEEGTERRKGWLFVVALAGGAAAIFGLFKGFEAVMIGGAAILTAAVVGIFMTNHPTVTLIICVAGGFALAGPYIWKRKTWEEK